MMGQGHIKPHTLPVPGAPAMPQWAKVALCLALCTYPVIGIRHLPLGDSGRYMSVLAAPLSLLALLVWGRVAWRERLVDGFWAVAPFVPFALAYALACWWHGLGMGLGSVVQRLGYGMVLVMAARMVPLTRLQVLTAAALGGLLYGLSAVLDSADLIPPQWLMHRSLRYYTEDGQFRAGGGGGNPIHFADVAMWLSGFCVGAAYLLVRQSPLRRWGFAICALSAFVACLASQSRGALVALLPLYAVLTGFALSRRHRWGMVVGLALFTVCLGGVVSQQWAGQRLMMVGAEVTAYLSNETFTFSSIGARLEMWRLVLLTVGQDGGFGPGLRSVAELVALHPVSPPLPEMLLRQPHFHNDLIQSLALGGVVLVLGHVTTLAALIWQARRDAMLLWVVLAGISFGLTDLVFHQNTLFTFMVSAWALLWATQEKPHHVA